MTEAWEPTEGPPPVQFSELQPSDVDRDQFVKPNAKANGERVSVRERLMGGLSSKDTPPRARNVKPKPVKKTVPNVPGQFIEPVTQVYIGLSMALMPFAPVTAMTIASPVSEDNPMTRAEVCARAWDEAAQKSEVVRNALASLTTASVWGGLVAAHVPIAMCAVAEMKQRREGGIAEGAEQMLREQAGE